MDWGKKHPERAEYCKEYYRKNKEKIKEWNRKYYKEYRRKKRDKEDKELIAKWKRYGVSLDNSDNSDNPSVSSPLSS